MYQTTEVCKLQVCHKVNDESNHKLDFILQSLQDLDSFNENGAKINSKAY